MERFLGGFCCCRCTYDFLKQKKKKKRKERKKSKEKRRRKRKKEGWIFRRKRHSMRTRYGMDGSKNWKYS
jgi:hypothetical protein